MQRISASQTESQLNFLAQRGAAFLRRAAVSCYRNQAMQHAYYALWASPLLCLPLWSLSDPSVIIAITLFVSGSVVIPVLVYAMSLLVVYTTTKTSRKQSLALYDSQLGLKDDLQLADEFRRISSPTAFELAALSRCNASLQRASAHALVPFPARPHSLTRKQWSVGGLAIFIALLLLIGAMLKPEISSGKPGQLATGNSKLQDVAKNNLSETASAIATLRVSQAELNDSRRGLQMPTKTALAQGSKANESSGTTVGESAASGAVAEHAKAGNLPTQAKQSNTAQPSPTPQLKVVLENAATEAGVPSDASQAGSQQESTQFDMDKRSEASKPSADSYAAEHDAQQKQAGQPSAVNSGAQKTQRNKKKQDRDKKQGQQQSSGSQRNSNSQNNQNQGDDAQKKSRGINQLMLAVPMEDQFIGTPGPGREKSVTEKQPSEEKPMTPTLSASRGQTEQSAPVQQKPATQFWEKQMLSNFFQQQHQISQHNENANDN